MQRLVVELREQQAEGARLDALIARNLETLGSPLPDRPAGRATEVARPRPVRWSRPWDAR